MAWTDEQQLAIDLDKKNILVSAAAGSGKTAVLVERVVSHLLRPESAEDAWNVDELLVVTFTRAAAAEMSDRIGKRLQKAIGEELEKEKPDRSLIARLEKQSILLSSASISTIDSFCQSIIKNNFSELNLDPKFRVADENELMLQQQDVLDEMFEKRYNDGDDVLLRFGESYGSDRGDSDLYDIVLKLHEKSRNQPFPSAWLQNLADDFARIDKPAEHLSDYTKWWDVIIHELRTGMLHAKSELDELNRLITEVDDKKARDKYDACLDVARHIVDKITAALEREWSDIYQAFKDLEYKETKFKSLPTGKLNIDPELREEIKAANTALKDTVTDLKAKYIIDDEATMLGDLKHLSQQAGDLVELTQEFAELYAAAKREKNIIDYGDMEHFALQLLMTPDSTPEDPQPSEAALALRRRYKEIMVDEYQDTNHVQDTIVRLIAGENMGNMFTVGDVKQSIYGFRASEPGLFIEKYNDYGQAENSESSELITLGRNFRSRREILDGVNFVFAQLMKKEPAEITYDEAAMLNPGEPYGYAEPEKGSIMPLGEAVELAVIAEKGLDAQASSASSKKSDGEADEILDDVEELQKFQLEAQYIADRLKKLKAEGYMVFDKSLSENNGYRPVMWRDMVILLRATTGKSEVLQEILQANDIPVFASTDGGYFAATEIQVMVSLLSIIDNAQQDIPLAAVLYSPLVGLSAEQLAKLRLTDREGNLYQAMMAANDAEVKLSPQIKNNLADFLPKLSRWRQMSRRSGVPELLWQIYQDTGYYDYVGCMPGGMLRQANLRMLITRAEQFENTNYRGLFRFLGFIEKIKNMETDLSVARTLGENEDVVRVMTIHKSKGLEFPVVVLADMGKNFNLRDTGDKILVHKDIGLGLNNIELEKSVSYPSFSRIAVKARMIKDSKAEELRVLYVALTRAREKLIMVGRVSDAGKAVKKWCSYQGYQEDCTLPAYAISAAGSYLDWVAAAVSRHEAGAAFAELMGMSREQYVQGLGYMHSAMGHESRWQVNLVDAADIHLPQIATAEAAEILQSVIKGEPLFVDDGLQERIDDVLNWHYDFRGTEDIPAKLSVSELKRRFAQEMNQEEQNAGAMMLNHTERQKERSYIFPRPQFIQRQEEKYRARRAGAEYGTLMHTVMQHLNLSAAMDEENIASQLDYMVEQEIVTADQVKLVNIRYIESFFASEIGRRMTGAVKIWRELPFSRMLPAREYYEQVTDEEALIFNQGIIDVLFQEADGNMVLLDYKTDWQTRPEIVREKYSLQLKLYAQAVKSIFDVDISEKYLYMLRDGSVIKA